ncbi:MAG: hypothetical protein K2I21_13075, partial [Acetatifactor sp.]|nr:hypothetical protein [Acetatifactor sp.]
METDLTSKLPLREHIKNIRRILRFIRELDKTYFRYTGLKSLLDAGASYLGLLLSVYILDQLTVGIHFRQTFLVAAAACVLLFVLKLCSGMLHNRLEVR